MEDGDRVGPRQAVAAGGASAFALGSLAVGATVPWLAVLLAVAAVVAYRLART